MATIRKRGERWQVQIRLQGHGPLSRSFVAKADAETWAKHTEARLEQSGGPTDLRVMERTIFGDLLHRYKTDVSSKKRGAEVELIRLECMLRQPMALLPLSRLTGSIFATYRDCRLTCVSGETVRRELTILRHVIEVARQEWSFPFVGNPVSLVKRPVPNRARDRRPTVEEVTSLLAAAGIVRSKYLLPAIILAKETGMRRGELLSMRWEHIDLGRRVVSIPMTKTGEPRTIPLTPAAVELLRSLAGTLGPVLSVSPVGLGLSWSRLCKRLGVEDLHWHDWRHEALSRFFELGLSLPEVALISGHKDPRMLMRYTHLRPEDVARKLASLQLAD
jgi:integrase